MSAGGSKKALVVESPNGNGAIMVLVLEDGESKQFFGLES